MIEQTKEQINNKIISRLNFYGFSEKQTKRLLKNHDEDYLLANIAVIEELLEGGKKIKNVKAYMAKAFQVDFRAKETEFDKIQKEKQQAKKEESEKEQKEELELAMLK